VFKRSERVAIRFMAPRENAIGDSAESALPCYST